MATSPISPKRHSDYCEANDTAATAMEASSESSVPRGRPRKDGAAPIHKPPADPTQPKRPRGRPKSAVADNVPRGVGVFYGPSGRIYINHGFRGATVLSQTTGAPGPSQPSQP